MKRLLILTLGAALAGGACGTTASDAADTPLPSERGAGTSTVQTSPGYREMTIPAGTTLPLALTSSVASDTSAVEDAVTAELTSPITIDGRDVLPAGTRLAGVVTGVDDSNRVKGRAMIAFHFTSLRTGDARYDLEAAPLSRLAAGHEGRGRHEDRHRRWRRCGHRGTSRRGGRRGQRRRCGWRRRDRCRARHEGTRSAPRPGYRRHDAPHGAVDRSRRQELSRCA